MNENKTDQLKLGNNAQYGLLGGNPNQNTGVMPSQPPRTGLLDFRQQIQADEKQYYQDNPQEGLVLSPTEWVTPFGMPVYTDQNGERHSESSTTVPTGDGRWMTIPKIWPDRETGTPRYHTDDEAAALIEGNGYINPISQEEVQTFDTQDEAVNWAIDRDIVLRDKFHPWNQ